MKCSPCDGDDCERCGGRHLRRIDGCPKDTIPRHIHEAIAYAEIYRTTGDAPSDGPAMNQTQSFLDAYAVYTAEVDRHRAKALGGLSMLI